MLAWGKGQSQLIVHFHNSLLSLSEDPKSTPPPKLEPTALTPPPLQGDRPLEPPTLRPVTGDPRTPSRPNKRLKLKSESSDGGAPTTDTGNNNCTKAEETPGLHSGGMTVVNGLSDHSPPRPPTGGVGRRTSVLFKKAKNGAKLLRERDNPLLNGKGGGGDNSCSAPLTPNSALSTPLSTPSKTPQQNPAPPSVTTTPERQTPGGGPSSDSELDKTPNHALESGE